MAAGTTYLTNAPPLEPLAEGNVSAGVLYDLGFGSTQLLADSGVLLDRGLHAGVAHKHNLKLGRCVTISGGWAWRHHMTLGGVAAAGFAHHSAAQVAVALGY